MAAKILPCRRSLSIQLSPIATPVSSNSSRNTDKTRAETAGLWGHGKNNEQNDDGGGVQVQCVETPDGELIVDIRTLTDDELERLLRIPRRAPKRVH